MADFTDSLNSASIMGGYNFTIESIIQDLYGNPFIIKGSIDIPASGDIQASTQAVYWNLGGNCTNNINDNTWNLVIVLPYVAPTV